MVVLSRQFRPDIPAARCGVAAGLAWLVIASADRGVLGPQLADNWLSWLLVAIGFGMIAHLAWLRDQRCVNHLMFMHLRQLFTFCLDLEIALCNHMRNERRNKHF